MVLRVGGEGDPFTGSVGLRGAPHHEPPTGDLGSNRCGRAYRSPGGAFTSSHVSSATGFIDRHSSPGWVGRVARAGVGSRASQDGARIRLNALGVVRCSQGAHHPWPPRINPAVALDSLGAEVASVTRPAQNHLVGASHLSGSDLG